MPGAGAMRKTVNRFDIGHLSASFHHAGSRWQQGPHVRTTCLPTRLQECVLNPEKRWKTQHDAGEPRSALGRWTASDGACSQPRSRARCRGVPMIERSLEVAGCVKSMDSRMPHSSDESPEPRASRISRCPEAGEPQHRSRAEEGSADREANGCRVRRGSEIKPTCSRQAPSANFFAELKRRHLSENWGPCRVSGMPVSRFGWFHVGLAEQRRGLRRNHEPDHRARGVLLLRSCQYSDARWARLVQEAR